MLSALCRASITHGFVVSGAAGCWLVDWVCVSQKLAFWLLLLHVVFVVSRNPAFWLLLLHVIFVDHEFSLNECPSSPEGGSIFCCLCILIGWVVCSGLEKKEASMFQISSNSFVILEINLQQSNLKGSIWKWISIYVKFFMVNPNLDLKSRNSQWICHFGGVPQFYIQKHAIQIR